MSRVGFTKFYSFLTPGAYIMKMYYFLEKKKISLCEKILSYCVYIYVVMMSKLMLCQSIL